MPGAGSGSSGRHRSGRYRYGSWAGGADPLAPPFDVRAAVDEIGRDVMEGSSLREAMERLMRRGLGDRAGLDELRRELARRRREVERRGNLAGTLDQVREELDQALSAEREFLAGRDGDDARLAEMSLDTLPDDTAGQVRELNDYQWRSAEGQQHWQNVLDLLRKEVLDAQFAGMKEALSGQNPAAMEAVREMMADLNALLAKHARGEDTTEDFDEFMEKHGEFFPENPKDVDELIDALARRQAAAERMMRSLSREQREELAGLMQQAMQDMGLEMEMTQLADSLRSLRPGMFRGRQPADIDGNESLGMGDAVGAVADLADLEALENQLSQASALGSGLDDVDVDTLERQLPGSSVRNFEALRELERELERQGYLRSDSDGLLTDPEGVAAARRDRAAPDLPAPRRRRAPARTSTRGPAAPTSAPARTCRGSSATSVRSTRCGRSRTRCCAGPGRVCLAAVRSAASGSRSRTSRSPRRRGAPAPRSPCSWTSRSRWSRRAAGAR